MSLDMTKSTMWVCCCAPNEDSDQPGHLPSLIRVFAVRMKKPWVLNYPLSTQRRLMRLCECPGWSDSSLGAQSLCRFCHVLAHLYHLFQYGESEDDRLQKLRGKFEHKQDKTVSSAKEMVKVKNKDSSGDMKEEKEWWFLQLC